MNRLSCNFLMFSMIGCALGLAALGCGQESALESRMKEFAYTVDALADELAPRLENARLSPKAERRNVQADAVSRMEADRGGDGDRPDPGTGAAIAADAAGKIRRMQSQGAEGDLQKLLLEKLEARKGNISADTFTK